MKKTKCLLLVLSLLLSMSIPALAAEEGTEETTTPTTHTVGTLDELKTALTYAVDNDTIVISAGIAIADEILTTDRAVTLTRSAEYSGDLLTLGSNGGLSGFTISDNADFSSTVLIAMDAENVSIERCNFTGNGTAFTWFVSAYDDVAISDCTFQNSGGVALTIPNTAAAVTVQNCSFVNNTMPTGENAITNNGILLLENTKVYGNTGGIYNGGTLTANGCEIYGNNDNDISNRGTLNITDSTISSGFYNEETGVKLSMPLTDFADTVSLVYLTDEEAAKRFAPPAPPVESTPPAETTPPPVITTPAPEADEDEPEDDYTPPVIIYRPIISDRDDEEDTTPAPDPAPTPAAPARVCGDTVIDLSRSVVLHGYGDGQLHLEDSLTRGQMATIIYRLLDEDTIAKYETAESAFDDVPADMWCCTAISTIAKAGIVSGVGNDRFNPNGKLTWAHIITVMTRFVEPQTYQLQNIQYDGWAIEAVQTAAALGWIEDRADLNPNAFITRGEFMDFVNNILALYQTI